MVHAIKDILIRMNLSLSNFRGQTYDGALNMVAKNSGVSTEILLEQPKTVVIHWQGHSLSLSVKSMTKLLYFAWCHEPWWRNFHTREVFTKTRTFAWKHQWQYKKEDSETFKKLKKISATRWTVRAECMKRVIDNYASLLQLLKKCLEEKQDQETKANRVCCKSQMESFFSASIYHTSWQII